jgi:hypothetical protein
MIYADSARSSIYLIGGAFAAKSATTGIVEKIIVAGGPSVVPTAISIAAHETTTALTFSATVTGNNPTGSVTFSDGSGILGSSALTNATTAFSIQVKTAGTYSITAYYGGDAANGFSSSQPLPVTVSVTAGLAGGTGSSSTGGTTTSVGAVHTSGGGSISSLDLAVLTLLTLGCVSRAWTDGRKPGQ